MPDQSIIPTPSAPPVQRYFWLPVPDESSSYGMVRHAFTGTRLDKGTADDAFCGNTYTLAIPSEMDWIRAPTCQECNACLKKLKGCPT